MKSENLNNFRIFFILSPLYLLYNLFESLEKFLFYVLKSAILL